MASLGRDKVKEHGSTLRYFAEVGDYDLLGKDGETATFQALEQAEQRLIVHLLTNPEIRRSLPALLATMTQDKELDSQYLQAVRSVIGKNRTQKCTDSFLRAARFTDAGRNWMRKQIQNGMKSGTPVWRRKAIRLRQEQLKFKNAFVSANLRMVIAIAKKYHKPWMTLTLNDLIQEGNFGLITAVERFDLNKGFRFMTYATWWVRHHVRRAIQEKNFIVRTPVHVMDAMSQINRIDGAHQALTGESLDEQELAQVSGVSATKVRLALTNKRTMISFDSLIGDTDTPWIENTPDTKLPDPEDASATSQMSSDVRSLLAYLTPNESRIIRWRFGMDCNPQTLQEIAVKFGLTRERIRQIEAKALSKLRMRARAREYAGVMFQKTG